MSPNIFPDMQYFDRTNEGLDLVPSTYQNTPPPLTTGIIMSRGSEGAGNSRFVRKIYKLIQILFTLFSVCSFHSQDTVS